MDAYSILIGMSAAVMLSYVYDLIARATKVPSVLLLLLTGLALRQAADLWGLPFAMPAVTLQMLGIVGLIMIVLEGAFDLKLSAEKAEVVRRSFLAALLMLVGQAVVIAAMLRLWLHAPWQSCLLNAVPLVVVSSAIAIPSVAGLRGEKQEFIVYEATFSDILGIMLFNFILQDNFARGVSLLTFGRDVVAVLLVTIVSTAVLALLLDRLRHHVKFFLVLAFLVLIYSVAKSLHLSSLVLVLGFGLALNNLHLLPHQWLSRYLSPERLTQELQLLKSLTAESAFLIRTFFFLLFGYSIVLQDVMQLPLLGQGLLIVAVLTLIRYGYLRFVARTDLVPELFIAPKGLISVLLFYSIPAQHLLGGISEGILFVVILLTGLLMLIGLQLTPRTPDLGEY